MEIKSKPNLYTCIVILLFVTVAVLPILMSAHTAYADGPMIWTDRYYYWPDANVIIDGYMFKANTPLTIQITEPNSSYTLNPTTDSTGFFETTYFVWSNASWVYTVTATDPSTGSTASTTFDDSPPAPTCIGRVSISSQTPSPVTQGSDATYTVTVDRDTGPNGCTGAFTADLSIASSAPAPPAGITPSYNPSSLSFGTSDNELSSTLTITTSSTTPAGSSPFKAVATNPDNSADTGGVTGHLIVAAATTVSVTVTTNPSPLASSIVVDGTTYNSPQTFTWTIGTSHTIEALSPISAGAGTQYVYQSWADGGAQSHSVTASSSTTTYTASYQTQYYLTLSSAHDTSTGQGWYDSGSTANFAMADTTVAGTTGVQYVMTGWSSSDTGGYTGSSSSSSVTMNNPITETAGWKTQYQVTFSQTNVLNDFTGTVVTIDSTDYGVSALPASFWWDASSTHNFAYQSSLQVSSVNRYQWTSTTGLSILQSGSLSISSSGNVNGYYKILATATYTGDTLVVTGSTINLRATVQEVQTPSSTPTAIIRAKVIFQVCNIGQTPSSCPTVGPVSVSSTGTPPGLGIATATYSAGGSETTYTVTVLFDPANLYYTGPESVPTPVTVYSPTGGYATGGGWIKDPGSSNGHGNFGFVVRYAKQGSTQIKGQAVYVYRSNGYDWVVKSTGAWSTFTVGCSSNGACGATFQGKVVVQQIDPTTGMVKNSFGNYQVTVTVFDNTGTTTNGGVDTYYIQVLNQNGQVFWQAGGQYPNTAGNLQGGQITVHKA